ncbi:hypothetical protein [Acinetobacter rudis]|uniref:hypothetical protein n=1 Tax=Acinetobacter rudis TaxID=632955 RepID=UPI003341E654
MILSILNIAGLLLTKGKGVLGNYELEKWGNPTISHGFEDFVNRLSTDGLHEIIKDGNPLHVWVNGINLNSDYILVGFHGLMPRENSIPPFFFFRGVAEKLGIGLISISDPSLYVSSKLSLAWYLGNNNYKNLTQDLSFLLDMIVEKTERKLILSGGSGGGFAALNIHRHMHHGDNVRSFVWNPQTEITKYNWVNIKQYFNDCVEENTDSKLKYIIEQLQEKKIPFKIEKRPDLKQLIFVNGYDHAHIRKHVSRFIPKDKSDENRVFIGDWGNGHIQPDNSTVVSVLKSIMSNKDFDIILEEVYKPSKPVLNYKKNKEMLDDLLTCRASILANQDERVLCIKSNLYEHFIGYQMRIKVISKSGEVIFNSDYLLGADICELYFKTSIEKLQKLRGSTVELKIEDISLSENSYKFAFDKIKNIHRYSRVI